jgi:hypothetical protein
MTADDTTDKKTRAPALMPDLEEAERFLGILDPDASSWTFQTFDDHKVKGQPPDPKLARILHGTLDDHANTLADLNRRGAVCSCR